MLPVLLLPFLWSLIHADFTSFHLNNYLNHSVSPCSDFYSHVCSSEMFLNETARYKSQIFYRDLAKNLGFIIRNTPIVNDIILAQSSGNCSFDSIQYKSKLQKRCTSNVECYLDEFYYFSDLYNDSTDEISDTLQFFASHTDGVEISKLVDVTSNIVELLIEDNQDEEILESVVDPYFILLDRLYVMDYLSLTKTKSGKGWKKLGEMVTNIRKIIADRFIATPWLSETDQFGLDRLSQFLTTIDEITIMADFDEFDTDLTFWKKIDRYVTSKYFQYSRRSTGCKRFDVIHPFVMLKSKIESKVETDEELQLYHRLTSGLVYNGFNLVGLNAIVLLAPSFYPIMDENSSDTTMIAYAEFIAHEMYHSFVKNDLIDNYDVFRNEANCMMDKFNSSCHVWAKSTCNSGEQTFEEDGPDVEGLRVAYELLRRTYSEKKLKELEYKRLGITREQAFFYAVGVRGCGDPEFDDPSDEHSSDTIRLNTAMSMLPEFSGAFGCKRGDEEYSEESSTCYLFGSQSGMERKTEKIMGNSFENEENESEEMGGVA